MECPLCTGSKAQVLEGEALESKYLHCPDCDLRFLDPAHYLSHEAERAHYLTHNNDVTDPRYQAFVRPLFEVVRSRPATGSRGLDYGAGTGPVLAEMLEREGYDITRFDPYFWPATLDVSDPFDFIVSCEVVEHFHQPGREFARLRTLLKPGGFMVIKTDLFEPERDFASWYYRRDPTHVVFYSRRTFEWIASELGFAGVEVLSSRVVVLSA